MPPHLGSAGEQVGALAAAAATKCKHELTRVACVGWGPDIHVQEERVPQRAQTVNAWGAGPARGVAGTGAGQLETGGSTGAAEQNRSNTLWGSGMV